jgi:hypothetical protein
MTNKKNNDFKPGDKVAFDIEGDSRSPFGYGRVFRVFPNGGIGVEPLGNVKAVTGKMINVRKADAK